MAAGMVLQGAGLTAVIFATFVLNLRLLIMSTCVIQSFRDAPLRLRLLASFGVVDESFAVFSMEREEDRTLWSFLGLVTDVYFAWVFSAVLGVLSSTLLPQLLLDSMGIAIHAIFIAFLLPSLRRGGGLGRLVLLTALCSALLSQFIAPSWSLIVSSLLCAALGVSFVDEAALKEEVSDAP